MASSRTRLQTLLRYCVPWRNLASVLQRQLRLREDHLEVQSGYQSDGRTALRLPATLFRRTQESPSNAECRLACDTLGFSRAGQL
jgi:hypothetical protein